MSSLYWKIFLSFWAVIVVTVLITLTVSRIVIDDDLASARQQVMRDSLHLLHRQAGEALNEGGETALRDWLAAHQHTHAGPQLLIVDESGHEVLGRPLPAPLRSQLNKRHGEASGGSRHSGMPKVIDLSTQDGAHYRIILPPFRPRLGPWFMQPQIRALFPWVLLLVSGVICLLLARYLTRPIRELSAAGQRIAAGDLNTRVGGGIAERGDEFGRLARDFDDMAERIQALLEARDRLLRDVSHELRSPLTRLTTASALLRNKTGPEALTDIERIEREADNLNRLIGQVLAYSRLQAQERVTFDRINLREVVDAIVDDARYEGQALGIEVDCERCEPLAVAGSESLLSSALENVIRNAIHHARRRVEVELSRTAEQGLIVVRDDGPGVPPDELPRMFEPFFTGSNDQRASGAGVGLAIARRAIELHGGSISAFNRESGGLEVRIELPLTQPDQP